MLIKIGECMVDPVSVVGIAPHEIGEDKIAIFIWMDNISHPLIHSEWSGDYRDEIRRVGDLLDQSLTMLKNDSGEFSEDGEVMVRIRKAELQEQNEVSYRAGWDEASRRSSADSEIHILESSLHAVSEDVVKAINTAKMNGMEVEEPEHVLSHGIRSIVEKVANLAGVRVIWEV